MYMQFQGLVCRLSNILALTDEKPVIWQRTGKSDKTHWVIFVKGGPNVQDNPA